MSESIKPELLTWYRDQDEVVFDVVPHSHLDYAWYRDRESSKMREVEAFVKTLLVKTFTLEQMITAKEFVEGAGERLKDELHQMIVEGRMELIGMYTQPDIFLSPQELRFWNYEFGEKIARKLGGTPPDIEYIPDTFGFDENTPMTLNHAGKRAVVFARGFEQIDTIGAMFWWQSPDDSKILAVPMQGSYSNAGGLTDPGIDRDSVTSDEYYEKQVYMATLSIKGLVNRFGHRYKQIDMPHMLLMNGNDFTKPDQDLPEVLGGVQEKIRQEIPNFQIKTSTLGKYIDLVMSRIDPDKLQTYHGEMRSGKEMYVLRGIDSARMELKQRMHQVETRIYESGALISLLILARNAGLVDQNDHASWQQVEAYLRAIEQILPVGSHDTISGCGSDDAYPLPRSLMTGSYNSANQAARNSIAALANRQDSYGPYQHKERTQTFVNLLPYDRTVIVELPMQGDLEHAQGLKAYAMIDDNEVSIAIQIIQKVDTRYAVCTLPMKGMSSAQVRLEPTDGMPFETISPKTHSFETESYLVDVLPNGMLKIVDKSTGTVMRGLAFEDQGDRGDEYNFCDVDGDTINTTKDNSATLSIVNDGPVFTELQIDTQLTIPEGLEGPEGTVREVETRSAKMVTVPISTRVKMFKDKNIDRIEFSSTIDNTARDHRLRVLFDAPHAVDTVRAKEPFGMTTRSAVPILGGPDWMEPHPIATSHNQGIVAAGELALFNRGLPEYEAIADDTGTINQIALTLIRSVGYLSRGNLSTRPGWAGPGSSTPEAQMIGKNTYEYAINFNGRQNAGDIIAQSYDYTHQAEHGFANANINNLFNVEMSSNVEMSTLRPTADGQAVIVRFENPDDEPASIKLGGVFTSAVKSDAYGKPLDGNIDMHEFVLPRGMVSIRLS